MTRKEDLVETATDRAKTAVEHGSAAWDDVVERVAPLLDSAAKTVGPLADEAWEAAKDAKRRAAGFAADTVERLQPSVNSALDKVAPAVDRAQKAVQDDLMPKLVQVLHKAAATPSGSEAREILAHLDRRADASVTALQAELGKAKKSSAGRKVATIAAVGAVVGALVIAMRTFLGSREDWAAYEPDEPYVYPDDDYEIDEVLIETDEVPADDAGASADAKAAPADDSAAGDQASSDASTATSEYGEGSYVGENPPEGYTIKGNERSMKYHVPGSAGYARTTAEVWFSSEEAAQAAGFVRSQR
jgi:hypothetical protein